MTPEQAIKTVLETVDGLRGKVYPIAGLKTATAPFVFYLQIGETEDCDFDGGAGLLSATYEINCVAKTYASLVGLSGAVRSALQALQGYKYKGVLIERATIAQTSPDLKEKEVNLYRRMYVLTVDFQKEEL